MLLEESPENLRVGALAMCLGMLHQPEFDIENPHADEVRGFPRQHADDFAWNIQYGLTRNQLGRVGREFSRVLRSGLDISPSVEVLMGHEVSAMVVFGACRKVLAHRGINEDRLQEMYYSAGARNARDFRAWLDDLPGGLMTFDEFFDRLTMNTAGQSA